MPLYEIRFHGRLKGAIGVMYGIVTTVQAASEEEALLKLYDTYENVVCPIIVEKRPPYDL